MIGATLDACDAPATGLAQALDDALARHLRAWGAVRDEATLRALVKGALERSVRRLGDPARGTEPAAGPSRRTACAGDPVVGALPLAGDAFARSAAAHVIRTTFGALARAGNDDPSLSLDDLTEAFIVAVWRGAACGAGAAPGAPR